MFTPALALAIGLVASIAMNSDASVYEWNLITDAADFAPRDGAGALVFKNRMWLLGGWNPKDPINFPGTTNSEIWSSTNGKDWNLELKKAPWEGRHTAGYAVHNNKMWIVGGDANRGHYQNDVWSSSDGSTWKRVAGNVPWRNRVLHCTFSFNGKIWVVGGQNMPHYVPAKEDVFYSDVWNSEDGVAWKRVAKDLPWGPRGMIGGQVVFKDRIWLIAGGTYDTPRQSERIVYNDVWSSGDGVEWTQHTSKAPWSARQYLDVAVFDNRMWIIAGYNCSEGNLKDVWCSEDGKDWVEIPATPWQPRHASSVFVYDNALWVVTGNNMTSDVWKLVRKH
jgi:hypothetical protein